MSLFFQLIIGLVSGAFGAWVAANFALRRFYSEKWWEKRASAFIELTDAVYQLKTSFYYYCELREVQHNGPDDSPNFVQLNAEQQEEMDAGNFQAYKIIKKYSQSGLLLLTPKATQLLQDFLKEELKINNDVNYKGMEYYEAEELFYDNANNLFNELIKESREVLKANDSNIIDNIRSLFGR
ncbi:hypothetical protein ABK941_20535 [Enterobacter hormaechei]|uniref:hypothetical protein n=1 Tax=Enterobacter hormaechei TaxID=158836 RepID=UPI00375412AA